MARPKRELQPLIPEDDLKAVIRGLIAVPAEKVKAAEMARPKRPKRTKQST
jgi:hypothetical protein